MGQRLSQLKQEHAAEVGQLLSQSKQEQASSAKDESKMAQTTTTTPLHNFHEIIAQEEQEGSPSQLKDRVMNDEVICLAGKTKKYWVHREIRCNCFILLPRALSITWGDNTEYWRWELMPAGESSDHSETMEVASLLMVCWLEIHGKLELSHLTPDVNYKVVFEVKLAEKSYGWARPVNLRLKFPDGPVQERKELMQEKPRDRWMELKVGEIRPKKDQKGEIKISLFEYGGHWKSGLIVKGVKIVPKD